ncbi:Spo0E family sporulation regulatory protein-aspartic acid phosphatase [Solibacillus sp. FSL R7-0682]|uniref:Spo0E family sporulation regulatory protein-aspartic acid phosphatase n=1 Tax=Solibacillus sp. FSL R7-0682 TaxID=2921690 RepID=UPI0040409219
MDDALLIELELMRQLMIKSGIENGLRSQKTLQLSKQVDRLMNAFEERQGFQTQLQPYFKHNQKRN